MLVKLKQIPPTPTETYADTLSPQKAYFVYAVTSFDGEDTDYMLNTYSGNTLYSVPAHFLEVIDGTVPEDWVKSSYEAYGRTVTIQSFPEMATDKYFYDKLMNDDPEVIAVFKRYSKKYEEAARASKTNKSHDR